MKIKSSFSVLSLRIVRKIPFIGRLIYSANSYAANGDVSALTSFTSLRNYQKILYGIIPSVIITYLLVKLSPEMIQALNPGDFIRGSYADILGFAIGIYALFFVIPEDLINLIEKNKEKLGFGPEIIASEMFYPLVVLVCIWAASFILAPFEDINSVVIFEVFIVIYGFTLILELLGSIYISTISLTFLYKKKAKKEVLKSKKIKKINNSNNINR
ncbi:MAG: hypothetical protein ACJAS1_006216 [Oleiphilaceae bacterium]|jgi:hypothetical protein